MTQALRCLSPAQALVLLLCLATLCATAAQACTKRLRWNDDPPYSMRLPNGQISGLTVELAQAALARLGCQAELLEMPFARAMAELKAGRLDMIDGVFVLPERQASAHFSAPVQWGRNLVFVRAADASRVRSRASRASCSAYPAAPACGRCWCATVSMW